MQSVMNAWIIKDFSMLFFQFFIDNDYSQNIPDKN
jgi:hypothetical protein